MENKVELICPNYEKIFNRPKNKTCLINKNNLTFCSRRCNALAFKNKIQFKDKEKYIIRIYKTRLSPNLEGN